ncbi:MAG: hypothetical protein ACKPKO_47030, partial [Candidatus Fonsibacter sp.]
DMEDDILGAIRDLATRTCEETDVAVGEACAADALDEPEVAACKPAIGACETVGPGEEYWPMPWSVEPVWTTYLMNQKSRPANPQKEPVQLLALPL